MNSFSRALAALLIAAGLLTSLMQPAHAQTPSPSASPDKTIPIDGVDVSAHDIAKLFADVVSLYLPLKGSTVTGTVVTKSPSEMPPTDPQWHYAGSDTNDGKLHVTVWLSKALSGDNSILAMQSAGVLGLLDSGDGGKAFQTIYAKASAADAAAGPNAKDPWQHRKDLAEEIAAMMMALVSK